MLISINIFPNDGNDNIAVPVRPWARQRRLSLLEVQVHHQRSGVQADDIRCPVVLDCTHSLQLPNQPKGVTGGRPDLIETMAKAGIAVGFDGLFMETHPDPAHALSDGANMLPLSQLKPLLQKLIRIREAIIE